jgi:hypothetical protein
MGTLESSVSIERPIEDVFRFFFEFERNAASLGMESVVKEPDGPTGVGTIFHLRDKPGNKVRESTTRFTAIEPDRRIDFDGEVGPLRPKGAFIFDPVEGGTLLTVRVDPNPIGVLKVASPLAVAVGKRIWAKRLVRIKAALESPVS